MPGGSAALAGDAAPAVRAGAPVEVLMFVYSVCIFAFSPASVEFIQAHLCKHHFHNRYPCNSSKVTSETADWQVFQNIAQTIPAFFIVVCFGSISDQVGRKPVLWIGVLSGLFQSGCFLALGYIESAPLDWILLGSLLNGLCGGFAMMLMACFASAADRSTLDNRTRRIALMEAALMIGGVVGTFVGGLVTKHMGVRMCFLGQTVLCGLCGVYLLFVTESLPPSRRSTRSFNAMQVARLIIRDREIFCLTMAFVVSVTNFIGPTAPSILYTKQEFGWSDATVGYWLSLNNAFSGLGLLLIPFFIRHFNGSRFGDYQISYVSLVILCGWAALLAFVRDPYASFLVTGMSISSRWAAPGIRSLMSKAAGSRDQGAVFSAIAAVESATPLTGAFIFSFAYSGTSSTIPYFFFTLIIRWFFV